MMRPRIGSYPAVANKICTQIVAEPHVRAVPAAPAVSAIQTSAPMVETLVLEDVKMVWALRPTTHFDGTGIMLTMWAPMLIFYQIVTMTSGRAPNKATPSAI